MGKAVIDRKETGRQGVHQCDCAHLRAETGMEEQEGNIGVSRFPAGRFASVSDQECELIFGGVALAVFPVQR